MNEEAAIDPIAVTRNWVEKAVIGLNLCPFAKAVYVKQQVRFVLSDATTPEALLEQLAEELVLLRDTPAEQIDTTLIVHPEVLGDFLDYNDFLENADAAVEALDLQGILQVASFHPQYQFAGAAPDDVAITPTARPTPPCTCCAKTALSVRWPRSRTRTSSSSATSPRWTSWAWKAGTVSWPVVKATPER